ncbi:MAG: tripartite tricarboxylate transporter substrate binding protein [Thiothrix sp.]|nr:tripartite tricarboxylate transporter substrate binding protein [Thiothrix sp.]HPE61014.1 tripartite tricarboxylate transporter substrate binding protein [Thiolinea sp.]
MKPFGLSGMLLTAIVAVLPFAAPVSAADYPAKDLMHIMPWSAGGGTDTVMRTFMTHAEKPLGVGVNTQNITGAQSGIGTLKLMKSRPDGYTIGTLTWDSVLTVPYYNLVPGFDVKQLAYLGSVTVHPTAIVVRADSPWETLEAFVAAAKAAPDTLKISNVGTGGVWHLPALDFARQAGIAVQHVPYPKGSGSQREALLSGETDAASTSISAAYAAVKSGQLRVLGVMAEARDPEFPDTPTFKEQGYDVIWGGFRVIGTQAAVEAEKRAVLEAAFAKVFEDAEFLKTAADTGMGAVWMSSEETAAYIAQTQEKAFALIDQLVADGVLKK